VAARPSTRKVRLQRIIASAGLTSRRGAEKLLRAGRVTVNDRPASLGESADPDRDVVAVDGKPLHSDQPLYWMVNKPRGVLTTARDTHGRAIVTDLLPADLPRLFPVGRLDRDTEGLVLLTNDGDLAHVLLHPKFGSEREYRVTVRGRIDERALRRLSRGIRLDDGVTAPAKVGRCHHASARDESEFTLTLIEGRKRQIRRSLSALRHPVVALVRVRMGPLRLGSLAAGAARCLTPAEIRALRREQSRRGDAGARRAPRR